MTRFSVMLAASALALPTLAFPNLASAQKAGVRAIPTTAVTRKIVANDAMWLCSDSGCVTAAIASRPAIACAQLVRHIGTVSSFTVGDKALNSEDLTKCNARAKPQTAMARN